LQAVGIRDANSQTPPIVNREVFFIVNQFWRHNKKENACTGYSTHFKLGLLVITPVAGVIFSGILIAGVIFSGILITGVSISGIKSHLVIQVPNGIAFSWDLERSENANRVNKRNEERPDELVSTDR
jgi:hypothetical protein